MTPEKHLKIGWLGCGIMGRWMCQHCITEGKHEVVVHSRTKSKCDPIIEKGGIWADTVEKLLDHTLDVIVCMVGYPDEVKQIVNKILAKAKTDKNYKLPIFVDMSTNKPSYSEEFAAQFKALNSHAIDAPVSGGEHGSKGRHLAIMVGGDKQVSEFLIKNLFVCMTDLNRGRIMYMGGPGTGQHTKVVNQILITGNIIGICEALLYAKKKNFADSHTIVKAVETGAGGSSNLTNLGHRIVDGDYKAGFLIDHFVKDMEIALDEAKRMDLKLPGLGLVCKLLKSIQKEGKGALGIQALILALEKNEFD